VIDVNGAEREFLPDREPGENGQKRHGVHAAGEAEHQMSAGRDRRRERRRYPLGQFT
jgi:hypothetical protein